jgi:hypothetical protein
LLYRYTNNPSSSCDTVSGSFVFDIKATSNLLYIFCSQSRLINSDKELPKVTLTKHKTDEIINRTLRETASEPKKSPLCSLLNFSVQCRTVSLSWKEVHGCVIFKKGDYSMPNNCRPISLLCCQENNLERIVFKI